MSIPPQWLDTYTAELQKRQEARMMEEGVQQQYVQQMAAAQAQPVQQPAHPSIMTWAQGGAEKLKEQLQLRLQLETLRNHDVKFNLGLAQERNKAEEHGKAAEELRTKLQYEQDRSETLVKEVASLKEGQEYLLKQYEQLGRDYHLKVQEVAEVEDRFSGQLKTAEQVDRMKGELKGEMKFMEERLKEREEALLAEADTFRIRLKDLEEISDSKDNLIQRMEGQIDFARGSLENAMSTNTKLEQDVERLSNQLQLECEHTNSQSLEVTRLEAAVKKGAQLYVDACSELEALSKSNHLIQPRPLQGGQPRDDEVYRLLQEKDMLLKQAEESYGQLAAHTSQLQKQVEMLMNQKEHPMHAVVSPGRQYTPIQVPPQSEQASPGPNIPSQQSQQLKLMQDELEYLKHQMQRNTEIAHQQQHHQQQQQQQQQLLPDLPQPEVETPVRAASPPVEPLALKMQAAIADLQRLTSVEPERQAKIPKTVQALWDKLYLARLHDSLEGAGAYKKATVMYYKNGHKGTYYDVQGAAEVLVDLAKTIPGMAGGKGLVVRAASMDEEVGMAVVAWEAPGWRGSETIYAWDGVVRRHNIALWEVVEKPVEPQPVEQPVDTEVLSADMQQGLMEEVAALRRQIISPENIASQNEMTELRAVAVQRTFDVQRMKELEAALQQSEADRETLYNEINGLKDAETKVTFWQGKVKSLVQENEGLKQDAQRIREQLITHSLKEGIETREVADTVGDLAMSAASAGDIKKQRDHLMNELSAERNRTMQALSELEGLRAALHEAEHTIQEERRANEALHLRLKDEAAKASQADYSVTSMRDQTASKLAEVTIKREEAEASVLTLSQKFAESEHRRRHAEETLAVMQRQFSSITAS